MIIFMDIMNTMKINEIINSIIIIIIIIRNSLSTYSSLYSLSLYLSSSILI